jgi:hypothetical protein
MEIDRQIEETESTLRKLKEERLKLIADTTIDAIVEKFTSLKGKHIKTKDKKEIITINSVAVNSKDDIPIRLTLESITIFDGTIIYTKEWFYYIRPIDLSYYSLTSNLEQGTEVSEEEYQLMKTNILNILDYGRGQQRQEPEIPTE